jgi:hypothetical protein
MEEWIRKVGNSDSFSQQIKGYSSPLQVFTDLGQFGQEEAETVIKAHLRKQGAGRTHTIWKKFDKAFPDWRLEYGVGKVRQDFNFSSTLLI